MPKTTPQILSMVERALDEFDEVPLGASIRRAIRIANLVGESRFALRMMFEIQPMGGHPPSNAEDVRRLMTDASQWGEADSDAEQALNDYIEDRKLEDGRISAHSIADLEFWGAEKPPANELTGTQYEQNLKWSLKRLELIERARTRAFTALCAWERTLSFSVRNEQILSMQQERVDGLLADRAPEILAQFNAVFRRLSDAAGMDENPSEDLAQAATTCRRVLKAVVDVVQPAEPEQLESGDGHALTDDAYKNRLYEFLKSRVQSEALSSTLTTAATSLFERFGAVDKLASKGVHASVAREEAEFCALNTYLLAGEVLALRGGEDVEKMAVP